MKRLPLVIGYLMCSLIIFVSSPMLIVLWLLGADKPISRFVNLLEDILDGK